VAGVRELGEDGLETGDLEGRGLVVLAGNFKTARYAQGAHGTAGGCGPSWPRR
jgi:hypothetical protein